MQELGAPPEELFATFDHEPLAAASLAQVHRATLPDGTAVVVKIQRPDVATMVRADLGVLQELAATAEKRFEVAQRLDLPGVVQEFADGVVARAGLPQRGVPHAPDGGQHALHPGRRGARPWTTGAAPGACSRWASRSGVKINDIEALDAAGIDRDALARTFLRAIIKQILIDGFFHADPHPGNMLVDTRDGTITFLDLGLVGQLTRDQRMDLLDLHGVGPVEGLQAIAAVAMRLCTHTRPVDQEAV